MQTIHLLLPDEPLPVPVTDLFDDVGDEVETWAEAAVFVAGPLANGQWISDTTDAYRLRKLD